MSYVCHFDFSNAVWGVCICQNQLELRFDECNEFQLCFNKAVKIEGNSYSLCTALLFSCALCLLRISLDLFLAVEHILRYPRQFCFCWWLWKKKKTHTKHSWDSVASFLSEQRPKWFTIDELTQQRVFIQHLHPPPSLLSSHLHSGWSLKNYLFQCLKPVLHQHP